MKRIFFILLALAFSCQTEKGLILEEKRATYPENLKTSIDLDSIYFHSRDQNSRLPLGAVPQGQEVTFRIQARKGDLFRVVLSIDFQDVEGNNEYIGYYLEDEVELSLSSEEGALEIWEGKYQFSTQGVYGYRFHLYSNARDFIVLGNNENAVPIPYVDVRGTGGLGRFGSSERPPLPFIQSVYLANSDQLDTWADEMIIYYIFPERFKNGNPSNDPKIGQRVFYSDLPIEVHEQWNHPSPFVPGSNDGSDEHWNNDFYGGDLEGIIQKIDYIASFGTNVIYLTPIFFAPSNHKYDTADYMKIDPSFGDTETFRRLVRAAKAKGIGIVLDASLNHSGSDSVYMDRYGKYPGVGAFENEEVRSDSPYYSWYDFTGSSNPDQAYSQWANPSLANIREVDSWKDFAFRNQNSITKYWLDQGAVGWRMDVVPWVSDEFWAQWRSSIQETHPKAITFAEVWFDASKYLLGDSFHSTMNYIFRGALLEMLNQEKAEGFVEAISLMQENYPPEALNRLMNLKSSHDVPRAIFELGFRNNRANNFDQIRPKYLLASVLQFTLPGAPTIFYGDEIGLTGGRDPYNRGPMPWPEDGGEYGDWTLADHYRKLGSLRRQYKDLLFHGSLEFTGSEGSLLSFQRSGEQGLIQVLINLSSQPLSLPEGWLEGEFLELYRNEKVSIQGEIVLDPYGFMILGDFLQ